MSEIDKNIDTRLYNKNLNEDANDYLLGPNQWTHARNAINNSRTGDLGKLGNEPSTFECASAPYTIIGTIHLVADMWAIFSTDDTNSEIGIFKEDTCTYTKAVNDPCLNFNRANLIKGVSRPNSTCVYGLYWDDGGRNVSRTMNVTIDPPTDNAYTNPNSPIPWIQVPAPGPAGQPPCNETINSSALDCNKIRLSRLFSVPCSHVKKGVSGGTLLNGSYMVAIAYAIGGIKVSDYYISNVQPLFDHNDTACSLDVDLSNLDPSFDQIEVVIVYVVKQQTVARRAGIYNTNQKRLSFDTIDNTWPVVPIEQIPISNPVIEKTDAMYTVQNYLVRTGVYSKEDFNYQPLANQIVAKWQSVEYPANYYRNGGNNTNYLRDEVYGFFIRWVYDTGDKSSEYHIPGRGANPNDLLLTSTDALSDEIIGGFNYQWVTENTATFIGSPGTVLPDGGVVVGEGLMGYWESTELYPEKKAQIWDSVNNPLASGFNTTTNPYAAYDPTIPLSTLDLCGKPIRHHRFPELYTHSSVEYTNAAKDKMRIMGVKFENIKPPVMNDGVTPIPGIVGYEILRGTRNGNKTIISKGLITNMREYDIPGNTSTKGYFVNYPYNDCKRDPLLSTSQVKGNVNQLFGSSGFSSSFTTPQSNHSPVFLAFHGPDTNFTDPYLNAKELKLAGEVNGSVIGKFDKSELHPKEKLLTDLSFFIAAMAGIGIAVVASQGKRTIRYSLPERPGMSQENLYDTGTMTDYDSVIYTGPITSTLSTVRTRQTSPTQQDKANLGSYGTSGPTTDFDSYQTQVNQFSNLTAALAGQKPESTTGSGWQALMSSVEGFITNPSNAIYGSDKREIIREDGEGLNSIPDAIGGLGNVSIFFNYFTRGTDQILDLFKAITSFKDFALRYHSHGFYSNYRSSIVNSRRYDLVNQAYIGPQITDFDATKRVNNLYRSRTVALETAKPVIPTQVDDRTRYIATDVQDLLEPELPILQTPLVPKDPTKAEFGPNSTYSSTVYPPGNYGHQICSSHYASLKQRIRNQYGQINGMITVPVSVCPMTAPPVGTTATSDTLFGGDTYVGRYTEKNTFFFFYDWLYSQPDGAQWDYTRSYMIPYPRFWANFNSFETGDFMASLSTIITSFSFSDLVLPSSYYNLDGIFPLTQPSIGTGTTGLNNITTSLRFSVKNAWFYLFYSGVKDFYVESEINVALRDWGNLETEVYYDPFRYTDTKALFDTKIIKAGNYYKYDQSLSISKIFMNYVPWGATQKINYDPYIAETCYTYSDKKIIYSLPLQYESLHDNWRDFLANNYYNFTVPVTCIKPINKSGALIFFESQSPIMFQGSEQLETSLSTKLTIGNGEIFNQVEQRIVNADSPYEYASCQDTLSVINTPTGIYWMSENQGKIFNYGNGLEELSMMDIKWWLVKYLPYVLTEQFPDFKLTNNPVRGIGCQSIFDNQNGLVYFCKKDYKLKSDLPANTVVKYVSGVTFAVYINGQFQTNIQLGDPNYFDDASWTISYDPKTKNWVSYHDWHPNLLMPGKNTFLSIQDKTIWLHNYRTDSYCNFYGVDYPFEIEYLVDTAQTVNTLRSVEYQLECYKYADNMYDRFHVLDYNFDEAVVYNTEQVSGLLRLNLQSRSNPFQLVNFPQIHANAIDILYSKVENRYRFNQFWDITADRGEYNQNAQRVIWNTSANGYVRILNTPNMNYNKQEFQRKKFRHYLNYVFLRKKVSGDKKMLVIFTNNKNLYSPR